MNLRVVCPACDTELLAPDSLVGRQGKCPECSKVLIIPRDAPRDEGEDEPRRSRGLFALLLAGFLGLLAVGAAGAGWYLLAARDPVTAGTGRAGGSGSGGGDDSKAAVPAGWKEFGGKDDGFRTYFPAEPKVESMRQPTPKSGTKLSGARPDPISSGKSYLAATPDQSLMAGVIVVRFSAGASAAEKDEVTAAMSALFSAAGKGKGASKTVRWAGRDAKETVLDAEGGKGQVVVRHFVTDAVGIVALIGAENGRPPAAEERAFFDSFELVGGGK